MRIAMVGCGFVANMYRASLAAHPGLTLAGVCDREPSRARNMAEFTGAPVYPDLGALLADPSIELILNLTNPREHHAVTRAALEAGKHVFSEKPMATSLAEAQDLVDLAEARGLALVCAPCTALNPVAQTLWKAARDGAVGPVRLVYAEMDDGMAPREPTTRWINEMGVVWPTVDEFETGCTVEHAGYVLTWLCAFFGPATEVTAFSDILIADKVPGRDLAPAPDFSVACIRFASGVTARVTNGLYAAHRHGVALWGDDGVLEVDDPWSDGATVTRRRYRTIRRKRLLMPRRRVRRVGPRETAVRVRGAASRDYLRAVAEMAQAIRAGRPPYADARFHLHVTELTLACHHATHPTGAAHGFAPMPYRPVTTFTPLEPMPWAR